MRTTHLQGQRDQQKDRMAPSRAPGLCSHPWGIFAGNSSSWLSHRCSFNTAHPLPPFPQVHICKYLANTKQGSTPPSGPGSHLLLWIRASPAALPMSPAGEASGAWKSQYQVYSPQIAELTALNKRCAGEGENMGCALQLCQYRLCCPTPRGGKVTVLIGLAQNRVQ